MKNKHTKKTSESIDDEPLDHEIDFSKSRPNPYWLGVIDRNCVRLLERDLADQFPDDMAVNEGLRALLRVQKAIPLRNSARTASAPKARKKARA